MGASAEARLAKRRINELEEKLKKLQRELQQLKSQNRKIGNLRKQARHSKYREHELREIYDEEDSLAFQENETKITTANPLSERCRIESCQSADTKSIAAGIRTVVVCNKCQARYSFVRTD